MSPPRKRGSSARRGRRQRKDWFPAFAGMTRQVAACRAKAAPMGLRPGADSSPASGRRERPAGSEFLADGLEEGLRMLAGGAEVGSGIAFVDVAAVAAAPID